MEKDDGATDGREGRTLRYEDLGIDSRKLAREVVRRKESRRGRN